MAPMNKRRMMWQLVYHKKSLAAPVDPLTELGGSSDCLSSTDSGNTSGTEVAADDCSEHSGPTTSVPLYTRGQLLRARCPSGTAAEDGVFDAQGQASCATPAAAGAGVEPPPTPPIRPRASPAASPASPAPPSPACTSPETALRLPPASPTSWAEAQRLRRQREEAQAAGAAAPGGGGAGSGDEDLKRRVKSILNKLTPERFGTLYTQLMQCGIDAAAHAGMLARVIFEEAVTQHGFCGMYADLCMYVVGDFGEGGTGGVFKDAVLGLCVQLFERAVAEPAEAAAASPEAPEARGEAVGEEAQALRKKRALGNVRFAGELLIRNVFSAQTLFDCTGRLLQLPLLAQNLEALAVLLTVVGPVFDNAMWPRHSELLPIFWHVRGLTFDPLVPRRVRCLLRDVVDLRDAGWAEAKGAKRSERPMLLEEVRLGAFELAQAAPITDFDASADFRHDGGAYALWDLGGAMGPAPVFAGGAAAAYAAMLQGGLPAAPPLPREQQQPSHFSWKGSDSTGAARLFLGA